MRHTKIVATVGPASNSEVAIGELLTAGVDVFRLNFSHGTHQTHGEVIARIRAAARQSGRTVAILQDLSGPKIRTGTLKDGKSLTLTAGDELRIRVGDFPGEPGLISTSFEELPGMVKAGDALFLDDGHLQLRVVSTSASEILARVEDGGILAEHKGINAPGATLASGLTAKDMDDLRFGIAAGVDMVALSFVQSAEDIHRARALAAESGAGSIPIVAKLERPQAVQHLGEILRACDAVMVARGDLGLELPFQQVPRVQKEITRRARALGIPVILATQVLESMRVEPRPTRAEVSDAANAVDDGVDAIMLAGETASGAYPVKAVQALDAIIRDAEQMPPAHPVDLEESRIVAGHGRAICEAVVTLAQRGDASAIVAVTQGGHTATILSALRPRAPIYAVTENEVIARRLALVWGVIPLVTVLGDNVNDTAARVGHELVERGAIAGGSVVVLASISRHLKHDSSNFLKLQRV
ncbi:MAG: pyruvate kinase [Vicinamibacterales bacterium]